MVGGGGRCSQIEETELAVGRDSREEGVRMRGESSRVGAAVGGNGEE